MPSNRKTQHHPFVPDFSFHHLQLADMPFDALPGTPAGIFVLRAMKAERLGRLLDNMLWDEDLIVRVPSEVFELVLCYILNADVARRAFKSKVLTLSNLTTRSIAMTLTESLRREGRQ
ncbi:MAG: hypothetical protein ACKV19_00535 [Verrucomicrobiales bacterium]